VAQALSPANRLVWDFRHRLFAECPHPMKYNFYIARVSEGWGQEFALPAGYRLVLWRPNVLRMLPLALICGGHLVKPYHLLFYCLYHYFLRSWYSVAIVFSGERLAHYSVVRARDFRFPCMGARDLQVGPVWTNPVDRRKGIAGAVLEHLLRSMPAFRFWWICTPDNVASNRVALRHGFTLHGAGVRVHRLGTRLLGRFEVLEHRYPSEPAVPDFTVITEGPDTKATADQMRILYTRYHMASQLAKGKDVLEVACGAGVGLGLVAQHAKLVTAGDIDVSNCRTASATYQAHPKIAIKQFRAESMPFPDASLDLVILFEALYYLVEPAAFFREVRRVLRSNGALLISSVNCRWRGFNPSPISRTYFDADMLKRALVVQGFSPDIFAAFPDDKPGPSASSVRTLKKLAVRLRLIPRTMKGKALLKRLFYGALIPVPRELKEGIASPEPLVPIDEREDLSHYRMLYAVAYRL
jgi:SAM-dependent methyltransferase